MLQYLGPWLKLHIQRRQLMLFAVILFTEFVYLTIVSVGKYQLWWPISTDYYDQLADGFRAGHLYLPVPPNSNLLAQANPFDPKFMSWWVRDLSLYHGKYYLYWGPVPGLVQAIGKSLFRVRGTVGDAYLVFFFYSVILVAGGVLIRRVVRRLTKTVPLWLEAACVLAFGLANPVTFLLASAGVYQAAIAGSQAFLFVGIVLAFEAVWEEEHTTRRDLLLLGAGAAWALGVGCRVSVLFAVAPLGLFTVAFTTLTERKRLRRFILDALCVGAPVAAGILALLCYNKLRFDQWFDFGIERQLIFRPFRYSKSYIFPNVESYLLRAPRLDCSFPYIFATLRYGAAPLSNWLGLPRGYLLTEPTIGLLYVVPIVYLVPVAIAAGLRRLKFGSLWPEPSKYDVDYRWRRAYAWFVTSMVVAGLGAAVGPIGDYMATMRFLSDVTNAIVLLGIFGLFVWYQQSSVSKLERQWRAAVACSTLGLTMLCGVLLGYQGYGEFFKTRNPALHAKLAPALSMCRHADRSD